MAPRLDDPARGTFEEPVGAAWGFVVVAVFLVGGAIGLGLLAVAMAVAG